MSRTRVDVVVHTHWDREWYLPYQTTVARLAQTLCQACRLSVSGHTAGKGQTPATLPTARASSTVA